MALNKKQSKAIRKKNRVKSDFSRQDVGNLSARDRLLIVCEDSKITPQYFKDFCADNKLTSTDIKIFGSECGSAPSSVYDYAMHELNNDFIDKGDNCYDRIYCVFDRDGHADFNSVMGKISQNKKPKGKDLIAVPSYPCFEFWILLHFKAATTPFIVTTQLSKAIKENLPSYSKKSKDFQKLYPHLKEKTSEAIRNSKLVLKQVTAAGATNPSSYIHVVIEDMIKQKSKMK